ncbi:MAG TPA: SHOCT domain-containing protein [Trebonia sp.]|jgi:phosphoglycerol transferase MdoB-like AlkP superfamily enzyme|nr:SHOCT domain-containing protein [Trebonia sp.]
MNYPLLDVFLSILYFALWVMWIWLVVWILLDIFRSDDLSGWAKAAWTIFVIIIPLLGVLVYLIARGHTMQDRQARQAKAQDEAFRAYVRDAVGTDGQSQSEELAKLASLRQRGVINEQEFEQAKAKVLS